MLTQLDLVIRQKYIKINLTWQVLYCLCGTSQSQLRGLSSEKYKPQSGNAFIKYVQNMNSVSPKNIAFEEISY